MPGNQLQKNYKPIADFPQLQVHSNVMSKVLTPAIYTELRDAVTPTGFTFDEVIQMGVDNSGESDDRGRNTGCVAGDEECYKVFSAFFDNVIVECHDGYPPEAKHKSNLDWAQLQNGCFDKEYVQSIRMEMNRNIRGICLSSHCRRHERRTVEKVLTEALGTLKEELKGTYYPISNMSETDMKELQANGILFNTLEIPHLVSAGIARDWPDARGLWYNKDESLFAWINHEDHLTLFSSNFEGNVKSCFETLCDAIIKLKKSIKQKNHCFMKSSHLGHITTCPSKLGGFRITIGVRLPHLSKDEEQLDQMLNMRGIYKTAILYKQGEEDSQSRNDTYNLSHKFCLGHSELEWVQHMINTVETLIQADKELK